MANSNYNPFTQFTELFENMSATNTNLDAFVEGCQKNSETLQKVSSVILDNSIKLMNQQTEFIKSLADDAQKINKELVSGKTDAGKNVETSAAFVKDSFEKSVKNAQEAAKLIESTNKEVADIITTYTSETVSKAQETVKKTATKKAA